MKSTRYILLALSLFVGTGVSAQELAGSQVQLDNKTISVGENSQLMVGMDVTVPADMELSTNSLLSLTPVLVSKDGSQNKVLPAIYVYGRTRQLVDLRNDNFPENAFTVLRREKGEAQTVNYNARVPYESWMNGAELKMLGEVHGCANCLKEENMAKVYFGN